jgi:acetyl-CoA acetyltransferase
MNVFVLGFAVHPPSRCVHDKRLEEMVFDTARAALDHAGVERAEVDHVTIAGCDELDGRSISSMLLAAPAGAYLRDEIRTTDSGMTGLCLGAMRVESAVFEVGLVVSWNKTSEAPVENVMRMRCEPFYTRPVGLNMSIADGLFAQSVAEAYRIEQSAVDREVLGHHQRAAANPRAIPRDIPAIDDIARSPFVATPLRHAHQAAITDGAVAMVLVSERWLKRHPRAVPLARIAGLGWTSEAYDLSFTRLASLTGFRGALATALKGAGLADAGALDVIELDSQTGFHGLAYQAALGDSAACMSPSGGPFAQNPYFCTGLVNMAEAVLQVSGNAGPNQVHGARTAAAHGCHGFAQQGNAIAIVERA